MKTEKRDQLLLAVKSAVAQYGVEGASTRVIAKVADVDDGHIYRFFKTKEDLLLAAYIQESTAYFDEIISEIDYLHLRTSLHLPECAQLMFHKAWTKLLSDPDYCLFAVYYYHSPSFNYAMDFHRSQLSKLSESVKWLFSNMEATECCMYTLFGMIFDFGKQVVDGRMPNTPETENVVFNMFFGALINQSVRKGQYNTMNI